MKILIDNGVVSSSSFLSLESQEQQLRWGKTAFRRPVAGFGRVDLDRDPEQQHEKDALFTIGRLARAGRIKLYTYIELALENHRGGKGRILIANALRHCEIQRCEPAIERSKFRQTIFLKDWLAKGGRKDRRKGSPYSEFSQIPYFKWLSLLSAEQIAVLLGNASILRLDAFEVASLHDLSWFQTLATILGSPENLPDCFHIWTARRNRLDIFLTLEKTLPRSIQQLKSRHRKPLEMNVAVLRPTELLKLLGIAEMDPVPIQTGRFYSYAEVFRIDEELLRRPLTVSSPNTSSRP